MAAPRRSSGLELVGYDYFAQRLGVKVKTIQIYAKANDPALRVDGFPQPHLIIEGRPYFRRADADQFIDHRISTAKLSQGRLDAASAAAPRVFLESELLDPDLVGYDYFAEQLKVQRKTVHMYATMKSGSAHMPDFPKPVAFIPIRGGHPSPRFRRADADRFIAERIHKAQSKKGRLNATAAG